MMQVSKNLLTLILSDNIYNSYAKELRPLISEKINFEGIYIISINDHLTLSKFKSDYEVLKVMDKFFLVLTKDQRADEDLIRKFFDFFSDRYKELIDLDKNLANIRLLISVLLDNIEQKKQYSILDFGSGIGLSKIVSDEYDKRVDLEIYGYDISKRMLYSSQMAGLKTLTYKKVRSLKNNFFDGVFASYSIHFVHDPDIINIVWQKLKPGGAFVANFHKDIGLGNIILVFKILDAEIRLIETSNYGSIYLFKKKISPFLRVNQVEGLIKNSYNINCSQIIDIFLDFGIISSFYLDGVRYVLHDDIVALSYFLKSIRYLEWEQGNFELYSKTFIIKTNNLELRFKSVDKIKIEPWNIALLRNVLVNYDSNSDSDDYSYEFDGYITLHSQNMKVNSYLKKHLRLITRINSSRSSIFANSASYMGSKKSLRSFIVEAIWPHVNRHSTILDLMCGSGSVSGSCALIWPTFVSDAMKFCQILAKVQGAGLDLAKADLIAGRILKAFAINLESLKDLYKNDLSMEDQFFHSEVTEDLKFKYNRFCESFPQIMNKRSETYMNYIKRNTGNSKAFPYLLFVSTYSNLYLGLRQSIELDSLRYGIDQLVDEDDKEWAEGALISTLSAIANTYGGHFAQPKYKRVDKLSTAEFFKLIEQRSISLSNEFVVRLREFALESQTNGVHHIRRIDGPWQEALEKFKETNKNSEKMVYLDAPYTRDEYSRYYHVLETLVQYNYPIISGVGRVPEKKEGNRFSSEFFTKNVNKLSSNYSQIIKAILNKGYVCAWSYSDNATVPCFEIIHDVYQEIKCQIFSYSTPYVHQAQGGKKAKKVTEYVIIFKKIN